MSQQHVSIPVPGVACAGKSVERALSRLAGVVSAYVNGATEVAEVDRCGFRARPPQGSKDAIAARRADGAHRGQVR